MNISADIPPNNIVKIMNSALMSYNKQNRGTYNPFIVDGTPFACDYQC